MLRILGEALQFILSVTVIGRGADLQTRTKFAPNGRGRS